MNRRSRSNSRLIWTLPFKKFSISNRYNLDEAYGHNDICNVHTNALEVKLRVCFERSSGADLRAKLEKIGKDGFSANNSQ